MFTSSVRRVALAAQPSPLAATIAAVGPRSVSTQALTYRRTHQRRSSSSSKPSSPSNGSKGLPAGQAASSSSPKASNPPNSSKAVSEKQASKTGRGKAKDATPSYTVKGRDEKLQHLPSVPSTHHVKGPRRFPSLWYNGAMCSLGS